MLEVELGSSECHDYGVSRDEMASFAYWVYYDHSRIEPMQVQEFSNKINTHDIPSHFRNGEGMELAEWFPFLCLRVKTHVTCLAVLSNVLWHVWPPVTPQDELYGFPLPCMSCNLRVMVLFDNSVTKVRDHGNIDAIMKPPQSFILCPFWTSQHFALQLL